MIKVTQGVIQHPAMRPPTDCRNRLAAAAVQAQWEKCAAKQWKSISRHQALSSTQYPVGSGDNAHSPGTIVTIFDPGVAEAIPDRLSSAICGKT